jgi:hypothetical protein
MKYVPPAMIRVSGGNDISYVIPVAFAWTIGIVIVWVWNP